MLVPRRASRGFADRNVVVTPGHGGALPRLAGSRSLTSCRSGCGSDRWESRTCVSPTEVREQFFAGTKGIFILFN